MMAGNPNWWNMNIPPQPISSSSSSPYPFLSESPVPPLFQYPGQSVGFGSSPTTSLPALASLVDYGNPELPQSWSQLLLSELSGHQEENNKLQDANDFPTRNLVGNWELEEAIILNNDDNNNSSSHLKQEEVDPQNNNIYCKYAEEIQQTYNYVNKLQQQDTNWSTPHNIVSSSSRVTTLSSNINNTTNILDFSNSINDKKKVDTAAGSRKNHHKSVDHSSNDQCNSSGGTGGRCKKARVQTSSSTQSPLKVRKEKLGDRITALHQMVSPFGKTDTASVLLEAIGYIRFLQAQIEALSSPYVDNASGNLKNPDESESGDDDDDMAPKDLRSRGLCLVPVSCTIQVGNDSGADYWAPAPFSGGF